MSSKERKQCGKNYLNCIVSFHEILKYLHNLGFFRRGDLWRVDGVGGLQGRSLNVSRASQYKKKKKKNVAEDRSIYGL